MLFSQQEKTNRLCPTRLKASVVLAVVFDLALVASIVSQENHPTEAQRNSLSAFLQDHVKNPSYNYKETRYVAAFVDLKDDGTDDAIVYFTDRFSCGSGGCTALILEPKGSSYRVITSITIARLPIKILKTKSNGWHDISVMVAGGGIQLGYEARLSFNGKKYPSNPTVPPARPLKGKVQGVIVIPANAHDQPLYE